MIIPYHIEELFASSFSIHQVERNAMMKIEAEIIRLPVISHSLSFIFPLVSSPLLSHSTPLLEEVLLVIVVGGLKVAELKSSFN